MTDEMRMIYEMVIALRMMTEEEFMNAAFDEWQGVKVSCEDADVIAHFDGAEDDEEENTIYWQGMVITYDPYEDWEAEEE